MKSILVALLCLFTVAISYSQTDIKGKWQPSGEDAIFKIFEKNGKFYGQLIGSNDQEQDKKIKEKSNIILLKDLVKKSDTKYCCGTMTSPENGQKADAELHVVNEDKLELKVTKGRFKKSIVWKRVQ